MTRRALRSGAGVATLALLAACATTPPATVILLPGKDGETGSVVLSDGRSKTVLDTPYASARASGNQIERGTTSRQEVDKQFGTTLASLPPRPTKYTLYFLSGTDQFTDETKKQVQQILTEVAQRPAAEVVVIGHTDRVGGDLDNDKLSLQRARRVKTLLIPLGIPESRIVTAGRGEREPIVITADNVDQPKNRRVEINVR